MTAYSDFISDPLRNGVHLFEATYVDPADASTGVLDYSTSSYGTKPTDTPASRRYDARVLQGYNHVCGAGAAGDGGMAPMTGLLPAREGGSFTVAQKFGDLDYLRTLNFDNQPITIRYGGSSKYGDLALADFKIVFSGVCDGQPLIGMDTVTFKLRTRDSLLYTPIQTKRYHGGNWCLHADDSGTPEATFTNNAAFNFLSGDPFSWEFWYRPQRSGDTGDPLTAQDILCRGSSGSHGWQIFQTKDDEISFTTSNTGAIYTYTDPVAIDEWIHVAICYDGGANAVIYLNGTSNVASAGTHAGCATTTVPLYMLRNQTGVYRCTCMIDEIRCWARVRTQAEVLAGMNRRLRASELTDPDLVGYWACEDGTGTTLTDASATAQNATLTGIDWVASLQGGDEQEGQPVPDTWGEKNGMKPVLVHPQTGICQLHSDAIEEVVGVYEGLNPLSIDGTEITDLVTFLTDTTEVGKYQVLNSAHGSYIRLRSRPTLPLSVSLKGDKSDGTYRDNPVELARYIVCSRGQFPLTDADDIDDAAFDAAVTATTGVVVGLTTYDETNVGDVVAQLLAGSGVSAWFKRDGGRLTALRYTGAAAGTPVIAFDQTDIKDGTLEALDAGSPVYRVSVAWGFNDVVHNTSDVAGAIAGTAAQNFGLLDWRVADVPNAGTLADHPSAGAVAIESALTYAEDAYAEAARLQILYSGMPQAFRAMFKHRSVELERLDCISLQFQDYNRRGELQSRFGTSAPGGTPTQYTVLALEENEVEGGTVVTFAREDNAVDAD